MQFKFFTRSQPTALWGEVMFLADDTRCMNAAKYPRFPKENGG